MKSLPETLPARAVQRFLWGANLLAVLAILFAWGLLGRGGWAEPSPVAPEQTSLQAVSLQRPPVSAEAGTIIADRPLFAADRRPAPVETVEEKPPEEESTGKLGQSTLIGILGQDGAGVILLRTTEGEKRLQTGHTLYGWTLKSIGTDRALFERETGDRENPRKEQQQIPFVRLPRPAGATRRRRPRPSRPSPVQALPSPQGGGGKHGIPATLLAPSPLREEEKSGILASPSTAFLRLPGLRPFPAPASAAHPLSCPQP